MSHSNGKIEMKVSVKPNSAAMGKKRADMKQCHDYFRIQRITLLVCLLTTAALGGYAAYTMLRYYEHKSARLSFDSITDQMEKFSKASFESKTAAMLSMRYMLKTRCPLPENWPHCSIPIHDYDNFATALTTMADITTCNHEPKILPSQIDDFVDYAVNFYNSSGYPDIAQIVSRGVFGTYNNGSRYSVVQPSVRENAIITPILQIGHPRKYSAALMFNLYSNDAQMESIDKELSCVKGYDYADDPTYTEYDVGLNCVVSSKIIWLVEDETFRPAVAVRYPFLLEIDDENSLDPEVRNSSIIVHLKSSTLLHVGSMTTVFHWDEMLEKAVFPSTDGLIVELNDEENLYTYTYHKGTAVLGKGRPQKDKYSQSRSFPVTYLPNNDFTLSITVHMDRKFSATQYTNGPIYGCIITVIVILFSVFQFLAYDSHVSKRTAEADAAKKKYVRYISHEIRTPLTTVSLGVKYVSRELVKILESNPLRERPTADGGRAVLLADLTDMLSSVDASTATAIRILNDLLNYDKIKGTGLTLDCEMMSLWSLVNDVVDSFQVQAREKRIRLLLSMECREAEASALTDSQNVDGVLSDDISIGDAVTEMIPISPRGFAGHAVRTEGSRTPGPYFDSLLAWIDRLKMEQVTRNLISNALKFTPSGGTIIVSARWRASDLRLPPPTSVEKLEGGYKQEGVLEVSVKDSGVGLSEENLGNIFCEGWQFDAKRLQAGQGSGLGLWISKKIVDLHGGRIECASAGEGLGSTMTYVMPLYKATDHARQGSGPVSQVVEHEFGHKPTASADRPYDPVLPWSVITKKSNVGFMKSLQYKVILIADDSWMCRKVVEKVLVARGYHCVLCANGREVITTMQNQREVENCYRVDLILLDYEMPIMDGPTTAKTLRQMGCDVVIIGLTGYIGPKEIEIFRSAGVNGVIGKPFSIDDLHAAIVDMHGSPHNALTICNDVVDLQQEESGVNMDL